MAKQKATHFWKRTKTNWVVDQLRLKNFLEFYGFAQYQINKERTSGKSIFLNEDGVLKTQNKYTVKAWVNDFLENMTDEDFIESFDHSDLGKVYGNSASEEYRTDIQSMWMDYSDTNLENKVLNYLIIKSGDGFVDTKKISLLSDKANTCHIRFRNGIVRITEKDIEIIDFSKLKDKGAVWEAELLDHEISLTDKDSGLFEKFCRLAMSRRSADKRDKKDWRNEYGMDEDASVEYASMRNSYGYLLHTHNTADVSKCIYFIDLDSELGKPQGGNGKSVVMDSVRNYKKISKQDGKRFRQNMDGGGRFQFADVDVDTKFILIDDIRPEFSFDALFSMITGDMEIERKGRDKFVISADKKPKFGVTTNYVHAGTGTSYTRRQHIVEFGNYWNRVNEENEAPSDKRHLGKMLFQDFNEQDWNDFYNYGFRCVQDYFRYGLVQSSKQSFHLKALRVEIEGANGDGVATDWIAAWINEKRVAGGYDKGDGISAKKLWLQFAMANDDALEQSGGVWNERRFNKAVWAFVDGTDGLHYNEHLAKQGNTMSNRRWLVGKAGKQEAHIKITSD